MKKQHMVLGLLRILMGWTFLWPFLDKVFGLGFATKAGKGWIDGASPTFGFLKFGTQGPFAEIFQAMAGNAFVDWLFMLGLFLIGLSLMLGVGVKIAGYSGVLLLLFMWLAVLPPEHNPIIDDHIIYIFVLTLLVLTNSGKYFGFGKWWSKTSLVKRCSCLK